MVSIADKRIHAFIPRTFIITISAIICGLAIFCYPCFADSDSVKSESVSSSDLILLTTEILRDQELHLNETSPAEAVRAVDYAQSIYNYLVSNIAPNQVAIYNELIGSSSYTNSVSNVLLSIKNNLTSNYGSPLSLYDLIDNIDSNVGDIYYNVGLSRMALYDTSATESIYDVASVIRNIAGSINGNASSSLARLASIDNNTFDYRTYHNTEIARLDSLLLMDNVFVNSAGSFAHRTGVDEVPLSLTGGYLNALDNNNLYFEELSYSTYPTSSFNFTSPHTYEKVIMWFNLTQVSNSPTIYRFYVPISNQVYNINYQSSVDIYTCSNNNQAFVMSNTYKASNLVYDYQQVRYGTIVTVHGLSVPLGGTNIGICINKVSSSYPLRFYSQYQPYVNYIDSTDVKYYDVLSALSNNITNKNIEILRQELASDDIISAKERSKEVIDKTLDNFTGSGSSAASVSDISNMSAVSDSISNGLDAGGSVSDALNVFNNNSSIWGWFSQSNYNDINNPSLQTRDYIIDFYSDNLNLLRLLHIED